MIAALRSILLTGLTLLFVCTNGQQSVLPHAHNDYLHARPLLDAVAAGFRSVEADVHLKKGQLLVGHDAVNAHSPTLKNIYLQQLDSLINAGDGCKRQAVFFLLVDLKTDGDETLTQLGRELGDFPSWLDGTCPVRVVVSGNVPKSRMLTEPFSGVYIDGRPDDLGKGIDAARMPWISDRFSKWGSAEMKGGIGKEALERIASLAARIHAEGKLFRLWAIPDNPLAWKQLKDSGVDLLNTDRLEAMHDFLRQLR